MGCIGGGCRAHQRPSRPANHTRAATRADDDRAQSLNVLVILSLERLFFILLFQLNYLGGVQNIIEIIIIIKKTKKKENTQQQQQPWPT